MNFTDIKFKVATIQFENLQLNADKTAIEANPSTHKIAEWIYDTFVRVESQVGVPKPNTTCEKNVCANCKHFERIKEYNNVGTCWNDEVSKLLDGRDILWNEDFGCKFFEQP